MTMATEYRVRATPRATPWSTVNNTSKCLSASRRITASSAPSKPTSRIVLTSCPASSALRRLGTHSSIRIFKQIHAAPDHFGQGFGLLPLDGGEVDQETLEIVSRQVVQKRLDRNTSPFDHWDSTQYLRAADDHAGDLHLRHVE